MAIIPARIRVKRKAQISAKEIIMANNNEFASSSLTVGELNALVKNVMRQTKVDDPNEAVRLVNSGEWTLVGPTRAWTEKDGIILFSVTSDGTTGKEWVKRLEKKGFRVGDYAKSLLLSSEFKPSSGVTTPIAVLKGLLFKDGDRTTKNIRAEADKRKLTKPNPEVACLIREKFTDEEIEAMGLWYIVAMHDPIKDSDGDLNLLNVNRNDNGRWLNTYYDNPDSRWDRVRGFAFVLSQVEL